jgi:hypothetical protein
MFAKITRAKYKNKYIDYALLFIALLCISYYTFFFVRDYVHYVIFDRDKADAIYILNMDKYYAGNNKTTNNQLLFKYSLNQWKLRKKKALAQARFQHTVHSGNFFFQDAWDPSFNCEFEEKIGIEKGTPKWVCNPQVLLEKNDTILVYSIGSNGDFSFEEALLALYNKIEIHTVDFTDYSSSAPTGVKYHTYRLIGEPRNRKMNEKTINELVYELGHVNKTIDVLKIDINGDEYDVVLTAIKEGVFKHVDQLLIEVHLGPTLLTKNQLNQMFTALYNENFEIFHKEPNFMTTFDCCIEYGFVKVLW